MIRFLKYSVVGFSGIFVDMAVLFLISDPATLDWPVPLGKALAVEAAILNNFIWNNRWTFSDCGAARFSWAPLGRFNLICLAGLGIGVAVVSGLHGRFGMSLYGANLVAILTTVAWNYFMSCRFGWRVGAR